MTAPFLRILEAGDHRDLGWLRADQLAHVDAAGQYVTWPGLNSELLPRGLVMIHLDYRERLLAWLAAEMSEQ